MVVEAVCPVLFESCATSDLCEAADARVPLGQLRRRFEKAVDVLTGGEADYIRGATWVLEAPAQTAS